MDFVSFLMIDTLILQLIHRSKHLVKTRRKNLNLHCQAVLQQKRLVVHGKIIWIPTVQVVQPKEQKCLRPMLQIINQCTYRQKNSSKDQFHHLLHRQKRKQYLKTIRIWAWFYKFFQGMYKLIFSMATCYQSPHYDFESRWKGSKKRRITSKFFTARTHFKLYRDELGHMYIFVSIK